MDRVTRPAWGRSLVTVCFSAIFLFDRELLLDGCIDRFISLCFCVLTYSYVLAEDRPGELIQLFQNAFQIRAQ